MASYKVIQDIEAEDKLVGPLTLRQFIYAGVFALCLYLGFIAITKHLTFFLIILLPIALIAAFFAFPWKLNQPTETWALAMIKFFFKPRKRIWNQSGVKEIVTITAPKVEQSNFTNNLSQGEVKGRLKSLANILDSRGWAVKNSADSFNFRANDGAISDRLVDINALNPALETLDSLDSDDILDDNNNPTSQRFSQMIRNSSQTRFDGIKEKIRLQQEGVIPTTPLEQQPYYSNALPNNKQDGKWFVKNSNSTQRAFLNPDLSPGIIKQSKIEPSDSPKIKFHSYGTSSAYPEASQPPSTTPINRPQRANPPPVTQPPNPVILNFASNNDLNVATLARQINKIQGNSLQNEVIIQLH